VCYKNRKYVGYLLTFLRITVTKMAHTTSNNNNNNNNNLNEIKSYKEDGLPLNPNFITGYVDGDGSFSIRLRKSSSSTFGYNASIVFSIGAEVNPLNLKLLERVKDYFGVGSISKSGNMYFYPNRACVKNYLTFNVERPAKIPVLSLYSVRYYSSESLYLDKKIDN